MARIRFRDRGDYVLGAIDIPLPDGPGALTVSAAGNDKADALAKAALLAERIASDPVLRAIMPPQAAVAIKAAKGLAAAAKRGAPVLRHFWRKLRGPGSKRLAKVLLGDIERREREELAELGFGFGSIKRAVKKVGKAAKYAVPGYAAYKGARAVVKKVRGKKKRVPPMRQPDFSDEPEMPVQHEDHGPPEPAEMPADDTYGDDTVNTYEESDDEAME